MIIIIGRTGLAIAAYLVHCGAAATAQEALQIFGEKRTMNGKGVTIPSQMRYVQYYENSLKNPVKDVPTFQLMHIRFVTTPNFDVVKDLCNVHVLQAMKVTYNLYI
jgi:phosphatidylinositol-3,4,5-trisphosphate 3-phosphatase/dual-specificity protein phosphatase PTEN